MYEAILPQEEKEEEEEEEEKEDEDDGKDLQIKGTRRKTKGEQTAADNKCEGNHENKKNGKKGKSKKKNVK